MPLNKNNKNLQKNIKNAEKNIKNSKKSKKINKKIEKNKNNLNKNITGNENNTNKNKTNVNKNKKTLNNLKIAGKHEEINKNKINKNSKKNVKIFEKIAKNTQKNAKNTQKSVKNNKKLTKNKNFLQSGQLKKLNEEDNSVNNLNACKSVLNNEQQVGNKDELQVEQQVGNRDNLQNEKQGKGKFFKRVNTLFSPRKLVLLFAIIVAVITVPKIDTPSMSQTDAIVTMLCIDRQEKDIVIAATVLSPGQDNVPNYQVFSGKGTTLGGAIDDVSITMGKELGFAQCEVMAVGENLCNYGVMQTLDYMTRTKKVGRNAHLISFSGKIDDFSQAMSDLSKEKSLKLENILNFDRRYIVSQDSNIESFYIGYFSDISLGIMPKVEITDKQEDNSIEIKGGDSSSSSGSGGGSGSGSGTSGSSGGGESQSKYFVNDGSVVVFKKGKKQIDISSKEVKKINYFVNNSQQGTITVENVNDKFYTNSTILLDIVKKKNDISVSFENDTPVYKSKMNLVVYVEQVLENEPEKQMLKRNNEFLSEEVVEKVKEQVIKEMQSCVDFCKTNKVDVLEVYQYFYKLQNKKFKKYLSQVGIDNYLSNIKFEFEIDVSNEY